MSKEIIINGRPDMENKKFGLTFATRFPPYVYSTNTNACLIHKVREVQFRWYDVASHSTLRWRNKPSVSIRTMCQQIFFPRNRGNSAIMCQLPNAEAVMCGRCEGIEPTFRKADPHNRRKEAHTKLGCLIEV